MTFFHPRPDSFRYAWLRGLGAALFLIFFLSFLWLTPPYSGCSGHCPSDPVIVDIPPGTRTLHMASMLYEKNLISHPLAFLVAVVLRQDFGHLQAGEYPILRSDSVFTISRKLRQGERLLRKLTIPEGTSTLDILTLLKQNPFLIGDITTLPAEGSLWPETYLITKYETRHSLLNRMQQMAETEQQRLWHMRDPALPISTLSEALVVASIIEHETAKEDERPLVASVYYNRLRRSMRLEADPTVLYGITGGLSSKIRRLTKRDLLTDSPHNTYLRPGLPPTPICNPGRASLQAALHPAQSEHLYFVADGMGGHRFAPTYAQHQQNVYVYYEWRKHHAPAP